MTLAWLRSLFTTEEVDMGTPKINVFPFSNREWGFDMVGANGEVQGHGEGYTRKQDAVRGAKAFQRNAAKAEIVVLTEPRKRK